MRLPPSSLAELERAAQRVVEDYEAFLAAGPAPGAHGDAKAFAAHHAAGRSALAHLEYLLKLGRASAPNSVVEEEAAVLLARARAEIARELDHDEDNA